MAEPETVDPAATAEAPPAEAAATETPTPLTRDEARALIEEVVGEREQNIRKDLDAAYKTLRRGEAKSDVAQKRIDKLEADLFDISLRGMEPSQAEVAKLQRQLQRDSDSRSVPDPDAEVAAFRGWSASYLEEEGLNAEDPTLKASFQKHAGGWTNSADLRVALTRAVADVHKERAKTVRAEATEREKKAREEERTKLRNENRAADGKIDKGAAASGGTRPRSVLEMSPEEWEAFKATRRR